MKPTTIDQPKIQSQEDRSAYYEAYRRMFLTNQTLRQTIINIVPWMSLWYILGLANDGWKSPFIAFAGYIVIFILGITRSIAKALVNSDYLCADLVDWQIHHLCQEHDAITPYNSKLVEPNSYDLTLSDKFSRILPDGTIEDHQADTFEIGPGESWLAHTQETLNIPNNIKGNIQGKSSWARLNLFVECAGLFDSGFKGTAVLELYNSGRHGIRLQKGDRIAQMSFHRHAPAALPYGDAKRASHYQGQQGAQNSWLSKEKRIIPKP